jgi:hypothetical protein
VITREEHKDYLTLNVVCTPEVDPASITTNLTQAARESIKFHLEVNAVSEEALPPASPPIRDERTWE